MHVLYATDGSDGAREAARLLASLPVLNGRVTAVTVSSDRAEGERILAESKISLAARFAEVETQVRSGRVAEELLQAAAEIQSDLLVLGSRGLSGLSRFFLGSVAERVARHAAVPVLVVKPFPGALDRVLLGVDGSPCADYAARWLQSFSLPTGCRIDLLTILSPQAETLSLSRGFLSPSLVAELKAIMLEERQTAQARLDTLAAAYGAAGRVAAPVLRSGHPAAGILTAAEELKADLVVLGSHGLSAMDRFLLGSVSEYVLRHAECSVLVVKQPRAQ